jgi:hypothetical protein
VRRMGRGLRAGQSPTPESLSAWTSSSAATTARARRRLPVHKRLDARGHPHDGFRLMYLQGADSRSDTVTNTVSSGMRLRRNVLLVTSTTGLNVFGYFAHPD